MVSLTSGLDEAARLALLLSLAEESDSVVVAGESRLKRRYPLPAEDPAAARSVYLAGLPKDADEEAVKELLAQAKQAASYGPVLSVRRLRDLQKGRAFTGQVFVEVEDEEKAAALLKAASHAGWWEMTVCPGRGPRPSGLRGPPEGSGRSYAPRSAA